MQDIFIALSPFLCMVWGIGLILSFSKWLYNQSYRMRFHREEALIRWALILGHSHQSNHEFWFPPKYLYFSWKWFLRDAVLKILRDSTLSRKWLGKEWKKSYFSCLFWVLIDLFHGMWKCTWINISRDWFRLIKINHKCLRKEYWRWVLKNKFSKGGEGRCWGKGLSKGSEGASI